MPASVRSWRLPTAGHTAGLAGRFATAWRAALTALATRLSRGVPGQRVRQHRRPRCEPRIAQLRQQSGDRTRQHVAHAGGRHAGIARVTHRGSAPGRTEQRAGTLQHHDAAIFVGQLRESAEAIVLHLGIADLREARRLSRMRRQHPVAGFSTLVG